MVLVLFIVAVKVTHLSIYMYTCVMLLRMVITKPVVHILLLIVVCLEGVHHIIYTVCFMHYILKLNNQVFVQAGRLFRSS